MKSMPLSLKTIIKELKRWKKDFLLLPNRLIEKNT